MTTERITLLGFATDEQIEALRQIRTAREAAEEEARRMTLRASEIEGEVAISRRLAEAARAARQEALIAAVLDGSETPAEDPQADADATAAGRLAIAGELRRRAEAKRKEAVTLRGNLRSGIVNLAQSCAQEAGHEYLAAARRVAAAHAAIGAAQEILTAAGQLPIVQAGAWEEINVPNAEGLEALRGVGWVKGANHLCMPVVGGDEGAVRRAAALAVDGFKAGLREAVGEWPMGRE